MGATTQWEITWCQFSQSSSPARTVAEVSVEDKDSDQTTPPV